MSNPLGHITKQADENWPTYLILSFVKVNLAIVTFFAYPLLFPLLWRACTHISIESQVRRSQHRQAIQAEARRRNARRR